MASSSSTSHFAERKRPLSHRFESLALLSQTQNAPHNATSSVRTAMRWLKAPAIMGSLQGSVGVRLAYKGETPLAPSPPSSFSRHPDARLQPVSRPPILDGNVLDQPHLRQFTDTVPSIGDRAVSDPSTRGGNRNESF